MEEEFDIIRKIDTENHELVNSEIERLWHRKRIGLKANFTRCLNSLTRAMSGAMYGRTNPEEEGQFDTSRSTMDILVADYLKLRSAYDKLSTLHERVMEINLTKDWSKTFREEAEKMDNKYMNIDLNYVSMKGKMSTQNFNHKPK